MFSIRGVPFMFAAVGKTYTNAFAMFTQMYTFSNLDEMKFF